MNEAWDHGLTTPVVIESIEAVRGRRAVLIRARSREGAMGVAVANQWFDALESLFTRRVVPFFIGKDATGLATLIDDIYRDQSNYKLSGMPFWACVAWAEFALLDLLGRAAGRSVAQMAGGPIRQRIAIYLSSMRRDTTPEQEVERFARRIRETGAKAIKLKIGGRMSGNADASSGRTEALVRLARQTLGDSITIYADANGSYDDESAIRIGQMLESWGVQLFEEPCPFDEYEQTRRVTASLNLNVSGGEQDSSAARFRQMIEGQVVDVVQPDLAYNGGFLRTRWVAGLADRRNMNCTVHSAGTGAIPIYMLQFAASTVNIGPFQEFNLDYQTQDWFTPALSVRDGMIDLPAGPGLGIEIDPKA